MVKIYKSNNKLVIYLPFEVIKALKLDEGEEVDFFKADQNTFIFAKKSDITNMILGRTPQQAKQEAPAIQKDLVSQEEILVLKKIDTLRYPVRTQEAVNKLLNDKEKETLNKLITRKIVVAFKKDKNSPQLYSISKSIYDNFLMRKKMQKQTTEKKEEPKYFLKKKGTVEDKNVKSLEEKGYVVLNTEGEAATLSLALEESIRQGFVLGTRAFNKKFYIVLRAFFEKYSSSVIKSMREGGSRVSDIAGKIGLEEDGARGILYLLAESGDVSEKKRDLFTLA